MVFRSASSLARRSPVGSLGAKSAASNTWRISISSPGLNGARLIHSIASSLDLTCQSQKPATSSLDSVKGPSITVGFPAVNRTRAPFELGWPLAREHHAGLHQLFVELPHLGQHLAIRQCTRFRVLVRFDDHHESHCVFSFLPRLYLDDETVRARSTRRRSFSTVRLSAQNEETRT